jgi:hypothetical protein
LFGTLVVDGGKENMGLVEELMQKFGIWKVSLGLSSSGKQHGGERASAYQGLLGKAATRWQRQLGQEPPCCALG